MTQPKKQGLFSWLSRKPKKNHALDNAAPTELNKLEEPSLPMQNAEEPERIELATQNHLEKSVTSTEHTEIITETTFTETEFHHGVPKEVDPDESSITVAVEAGQDSVISESNTAPKMGIFARLKQSLNRTRVNIGSGFHHLFKRNKIDDELFEELEEQLLIADVGIHTTAKIIQSLQKQIKQNKEKSDPQSVYQQLQAEMNHILTRVSQPLDTTKHKPFVLLMVGVNGVGKTTTIGKLAKQFQQQGKSVMLAAGDTFRAAAVEQLQTWGERNNIPVVAQQTGADSAAVLFDAMQSATARKIDILIADTAGRLQNKSYLMEELKKIVRVMQKVDPNAPHEIMLTLDASTGQNAISQTKLFHEAVNLTGISLTKLDGTAKGGVIFAIADQFEIPIRYIGIGEKIDDLRPFNANDFIEALFAKEENDP